MKPRPLKFPIDWENEVEGTYLVKNGDFWGLIYWIPAARWYYSTKWEKEGHKLFYDNVEFKKFFGAPGFTRSMGIEQINTPDNFMKMYIKKYHPDVS